MADRRVVVAPGVAIVAAAAALAGCGDGYQQGAGVYTTTTTTAASAATSEIPVLTGTVGEPPAQTTDPTGPLEGSEAPELSAGQRRQVTAARRAADRFLPGYLAYTYGRRDAARISAIAPALRDELAARPPRVPARVRARDSPTVGRVQLSGVDTRTVILLADVDDGQARYSVLLEVRDTPGGWRVARVQ
ncbi:MAG: hypothetical protein ACR2KP_13820 [Egibacteraceae bacterium]